MLHLFFVLIENPLAIIKHEKKSFQNRDAEYRQK